MGLLSSAQQITSISQVIDRNPDIIDCSQVEDVELDIVEMSEDMKRTVGDHKESCDPPEWTYRYTFTVGITVSHPRIGKMRVPLNGSEVRVRTVGKCERFTLPRRISDWVLDAPELNIENNPRVFSNDSLLSYLMNGPYEMPDYAYGFLIAYRTRRTLAEKIGPRPRSPGFTERCTPLQTTRPAPSRSSPLSRECNPC